MFEGKNVKTGFMCAKTNTDLALSQSKNDLQGGGDPLNRNIDRRSTLSAMFSDFFSIHKCNIKNSKFGELMY